MEKQLHLNLLASKPPMAGLQSGSKLRMGPGRKRDFTPLPWSQYFETMEDVENLQQWLSWSRPDAPSWRRSLCTVLGSLHCDTKVKNPDDLSAETMAKDIGKVVEALYGENPPPIMIIGHSMGGAIAVHTAASNHVPSLLGLCVIDVVEGTAMDALNSMQNFLRSRPKTFKSVENAIEWSVKSGQIRNIESARVSMVGQVKKCEEPLSSPGVSKSISEGIIEEEEEDEEGGECNHKRKKEDDQEIKKECLYTWRIELSKTEKYWEGWFKGLSSLFLTCSVPKLLLLAGVDRLDKDLTIGQMQGKFQMQVLPQCGHAVHEDAPEKVADALATFMVRHRQRVTFTRSLHPAMCRPSLLSTGDYNTTKTMMTPLLPTHS
ncbi:Protein phosphatase methylesterase 1 [Labeo rohita]|uniref:Protein phosphatase methylesterase 1 n=1 Tax=Labeo rohita TaxID=84645 RepID=A0ABQ8LKZ9_LABRO|nr:Protein phosphatase methylesterase 1 [Labeo rohita]